MSVALFSRKTLAFWHFARRRRLDTSQVVSASRVGSSSVTLLKRFDRGFYAKENDYLIY
jgi:hypothetical protein